jgi:large subunit ribosomal protein L4
VVDTFDLPEIRTRLVVERLRELELDDVLIVTRDREPRLEKAAGNLPRVRVLAAAGLNVFDVLARKQLLLVGAAVDAVAERLQ